MGLSNRPRGAHAPAPECYGMDGAAETAGAQGKRVKRRKIGGRPQQEISAFAARVS
jgi:hypothetical protein